jgi:hypothetical protein
MSAETYSIIVPVWGATHVARFLDWVIPSWLSPSNIPHLASSARIELILLTSNADHDRILSHPIAATLGRFCQLKFVEIDDLVPGSIPTVTLTLAFVRGVATAMKNDQSPNIIFLNADFLLSDGSLASVARHLAEGQRVLLSPSMRVIETQVMPELERMRQADGSMIVPAREAVRLALKDLHPTVVACRVDQPLLQSAHPNQFFWQVDATTLLLRAFLLFPLAVKPSRAPGPVDTFCDYGWISTLAPGAPVDIIQSTDEFFAVELAPETQELGFIHPGPVDSTDIAHRISVWANDFSRAQPLTTLVFNAAEPSPQRLHLARETSQAFIDDLLPRLGPAPPMSNHPYWVAGATVYLENRQKAGIGTPPSEMAPLPTVSNTGLALNSRIRSYGIDLLMGTAGARRFWHPFRNADRIMAAIGPSRLVGSEPIAYDRVKSDDGVPMAAADCQNHESMTAAVKNLAAAVGPGDRAFLVAGLGRNSLASVLDIKERTAVLLALDPYFSIVTATDLVTSLESGVVKRHRHLASQMHLVSIKLRLKLIIASALALVAMGLANLRKSNAYLPMMDRGVAAMLLELQKRAE